MNKISKIITFDDVLQKWPQHENIVRLLILHHSQYDQITIMQNLNSKIDFDFNSFSKDMQRYLDGEPIQYVIGHTFFLDCKIITNKDVFIPRPETELLVGELIGLITKHFSSKKDLVISDICSGSGAGAIALSKAFPDAKVWGLEISEKALLVATKNNLKNNTKVKFKKSNIDEFLITNNIKSDVIFCNPPYIKQNSDLLSEQVVAHEPHLALFDDKGDGLSFHFHLLDHINKITNHQAILVFEIGVDQDQILTTYLQQKDYSFFFIKDYNNIKRGLVVLKNVTPD